AENGKDVRGEDNEGLPRCAEDRRDGIGGEEQVGGLHHQENQRQGGEGFAALPTSHEARPVESRRDGIEFSRPLDDAVVLRTHLSPDEEQLEAAVEEKSGEDVEDPI